MSSTSTPTRRCRACSHVPPGAEGRAAAPGAPNWAPPMRRRGRTGPTAPTPSSGMRRRPTASADAAGEIRWVDLDPVRGAEADKRRPAVIVSNDGANTTANRLGRASSPSFRSRPTSTHVYPFQRSSGGVHRPAARLEGPGGAGALGRRRPNRRPGGFTVRPGPRHARRGAPTAPHALTPRPHDAFVRLSTVAILPARGADRGRRSCSGRAPRSTSASRGRPPGGKRNTMDGHRTHSATLAARTPLRRRPRREVDVRRPRSGRRLAGMGDVVSHGVRPRDMGLRSDGGSGWRARLRYGGHDPGRAGVRYKGRRWRSSGGPRPVSGALTRADGSYNVPVAPGNYRVKSSIRPSTSSRSTTTPRPLGQARS